LSRFLQWTHSRSPLKLAVTFGHLTIAMTPNTTMKITTTISSPPIFGDGLQKSVDEDEDDRGQEDK
jgi:hypothetical protein